MSVYTASVHSVLVLIWSVGFRGIKNTNVFTVLLLLLSFDPFHFPVAPSVLIKFTCLGNSIQSTLEKHHTILCLQFDVKEICSFLQGRFYIPCYGFPEVWLPSCVLRHTVLLLQKSDSVKLSCFHHVGNL